MKKTTTKSANRHQPVQFKLTPARLIFFGTSLILTLMFICGIILTLIPENRFDPLISAELASEILSASFRVAALGAIFITLAAALSARYPDTDE